MTDRPDVPDSAVILTLSRVEFGMTSVLDSLRRLLRMRVPGHTEW